MAYIGPITYTELHVCRDHLPIYFPSVISHTMLYMAILYTLKAIPYFPRSGEASLR